MADSDLYLRYILGQVEAETLHTTPERHIRCNPTLAQFIVDDAFTPVVVEGDFDKRQLDAAFRQQQEQRVTLAWRRLQQVAKSDVPITEYPLET
jgi:hypothetical protein